MNRDQAAQLLVLLPFPVAIVSASREVVAKNDLWMDSDALDSIVADGGQFDSCLKTGQSDFIDPQLRFVGRLKRVLLLNEGRCEDAVVVALFDILDLQVGANIWDVEGIHQKKLKDLSEMAAGIAHEINNPLSVVMAKIHSLQAMIENKTTIEAAALAPALEKISHHAQRIYKTVKAMRDYSRDARSDSMSSTQLETIVAGSLDVLNARIRDSGVNIEVVGLTPEMLVPCRPAELMQVFTNLVQNALDAIHAVRFPRIRIEVVAVETLFEITVSDNGPGVSLAAEAKIFAPFFTTKAPGVGTGIGLSISQRIVKDHAGTLTFDRLRGPSSFVIRLPKYRHNTQISETSASKAA